MGIIAWIDVGLTAGLPANIPLPGKDHGALFSSARLLHRSPGRQLGQASDIMMAHPLALQLRNLQSLVEIGVDKNTAVVFPGPPPPAAAGPIPPPLPPAEPP